MGKLFLGFVGLIVFFGIIGTFVDDSPTKAIGCVVPNTPIKYSLINEKDRASDVKGIYIRECYILLEQQAPSTEKMIELATVLGNNNQNIEFRIFDDKQAYEIYFVKYQDVLNSGGKDTDISKRNWDIVDKHWLALYLKAKTVLNTNTLTLLSDNYESKGEDIQINN